MSVASRVREYAAIVRRLGPDSRTAKQYRIDNSHDLAFLAYACAIDREWWRTESYRDHQENRRRPS